MTTITAYPDTDTGSITLDVLTTASVTKVVRVNANGTEEVRTSQGQLPTSGSASVTRTNLIINPSFETGTTGYSAATGDPTAITNELTGGLFGSRTARATTTAEFPANTLFGIKVQVSLTGGKSYTISYHGQASSGASTGGAPYVLDTVTGSQISGIIYTSTVGSWKRAGKYFTVPGTGTKTIEFRFYGSFYGLSGTMTPVGTYVDFDGILLEETPKASGIASYFDGSTTDVSGIDYAWTGTAHASTSTITSLGPRLILTDYEAAQGLNSYNAYHADGSFVTASTTLELDKPWLSVPVMPQYSERVETITQFGSSRDAATTVHRPLGRADNLVVMGKLGDRTGTLGIWCKSYADARRLERLFERGEIVQLRQRVEGMDMYFTATGIPVAPFAVQGEAETRWSLSINYVEVRRPIGLLAGALGWTYDAMAADFVSYDAVTAAFTDYDALTLGDAIV
jgi:hypothetical protein